MVILSKYSEFSTSQRIFANALIAFVFYGAWGYLVNAMHGVAEGLKTGFVQGGYSFAVTLGMTLLIEGLYRQSGKFTDQVFVRIWSTIVLSCLVVFSGSWWVNVMAGTMEIFETVVLGYIVGGGYAIVYVYGLARKQSD